LSLLPSVRGLKPASKPPPASPSPLRSGTVTPARAHEAASGVSALADSDAQAIEEFREKFIKSGAIKFASLRDAFRKIDANKNGEATGMRAVWHVTVRQGCWTRRS
jgi:hypothetical protein